MPPIDRAARLGMTIAISAVLVIVLASAGIFVLIKYAPAGLGVTHLQLAAGSPAGANVVLRRSFQRRFMAAAVLDLPPVPPQNDSPSLQISFFQPDALVQGGVIRTPANKFRLVGFLAFSHSGVTQTQVRYFGALADGPHTVRMTGDEQNVVLAIDGKILDSVPRATFLPDDGANDPWLMLGTAVGSPGDAAFGKISRIYVQDENDRAAQAAVPNCIVTTGAITMERFGMVWRLGGRYNPAILAQYRNCSPKELRA
jgi:hypothetical protein